MRPKATAAGFFSPFGFMGSGEPATAPRIPAAIWFTSLLERFGIPVLSHGALGSVKGVDSQNGPITGDRGKRAGAIIPAR